MPKKLTTEEFIKKAIDVHGDKYGYDRVIYQGNEIQVQIYCKQCKKYFSQTSHNHLSGNGCKSCGTKKRVKSKTKTTERFIREAKNIHGPNKYGYNKVIYKSDKIKVCIWCNKCKKYFWQTPHNHLRGYDCIKCSINIRAIKKTKTKEQVIKEFIFVHGNTYGYDKFFYVNTETNVLIWCKKCKKYFIQTPHNHLQGQGCPICRESKGEKEVSKYLNENNIKYESQKRFNGCRNKQPLSFDFYLPEYNVCIEYQGEQHYKKPRSFGNKIFTIKESIKMFNNIQKNDKIKREYCKNNNITLIEIPYGDFKNIETIILDIINTYKLKEYV